MYVCHKLLRWSVPFFLLIALFSGTCLIKTTETFKIIGTFQLAFYFVAFVGLSIPKLNTVKLIKVFSFFVMVNVSILVAWIKYLKGERIVLWQSSIR